MDLELGWDDDHWVRVRTRGFSRQFIDAFKESIRVRTWNPDDRVWLIPESEIGALYELADEWGVGIDDLGDSPCRAAKQDPAAALYAVLGCVPSAPDAVLKAAHKALSLLLHPDRPGGDLRRMQDVNAAFDRICKIRGVK